MRTLWLLYSSEEWPESFLLFSIILFISGSLICLALLLISRLTKIYYKKLEARYIPVIDKILFAVLFGNDPVHKVMGSKAYQTLFKNKNFKKKLLQTIIQLHANYSGVYSFKLEEYYRKLGLINISFAKLKSNSWDNKCEGIRELSQMNVKEAFSEIYKCFWHKEDILKLEAILGLIRLEGLEGLTVLMDYTEPINDWIQLNVLYEIDNSNLTTAKNFSDFLASKNESVVILGLRLIARFNQIENIEQVVEIKNSNASFTVKSQAERTLARLPSGSIYNRGNG